jgi:hypothetical protein
MDPITAAILAAVATGVTEVGKQAVVDAYGALKTKLQEKFGGDSDLVEAVDKLEKKPESAGWKEEVETQIQATGAGDDADLQQLAQAVLEALQGTSEGQQALSKYQIDVRDSQIGVIGDKAKIEGGIHFGTRQE